MMELELKKMDLEKILLTEEFISKMGNEPVKDYNVKKLLNNPNLTQSQCIKFGKIFEGFIKGIISNFNYEIIHEEYISIIGKQKDVDICFIMGDKIYYFESKLNLNLDSEKSKATDKKISDVTNQLQKIHPDKEIMSGLLTCWWEHEKGINVKTKTKLFYMKDFFELMGAKTTKENYYSTMKKFGEQI